MEVGQRRKVPLHRVSRPLLDGAVVGDEGGADQSLTAAAKAGEKPSGKRQEADAGVMTVERVMRVDPTRYPCSAVLAPP